MYPLMFDTVSVAMETYYSQCPRQENQALAHNRENVVDTSTQQREAIKLAHGKRAHGREKLAHSREKLQASTRQESGTSTRQTNR